jgi:hypothetical protein
VTVPVPAVEPGSYCLTARADSGDAVTEAIETNNQAAAPVSVAGTTATLVPYVDPTQFEMVWPMHSHYKQPWRAWLETVPGDVFRSGVGIYYDWHLQRASHDVEMRLLAEAGFSRIRIELNWGNVIDYDTGGLTREASSRLTTILGAARAYGIRPLILLNAYHGVPTPARQLQRTVALDAPAGARSVVLSDVTGIATNYTGLSNLSEYKMAEVLVTGVNPTTRTVSLSKPLAAPLRTGDSITLHVLKYLPLFKPGMPQYEDTSQGWVDYVRAVARAVTDAGIASFDVEIWNELTFGSDFLSVNNYYDPPLLSVSGSPYRPGGAAWELAKRTVDMLASEYPGVVPIWGFSNTTFFHTAVDDLPPGTLGQSYHPYFFLDYRSIADEQNGFSSNLEQYAPPAPPYRVLMPEGAGTYVKAESLTWHLNPIDRQTRPSGSPSFQHVMTEFGFDPSEKGITDPDAAELLKAKTVLRASFFWLNKGLSALWFFADLNAGGRMGFSLLPEEVKDISALPADSTPYKTPAMLALMNAQAFFADAAPIASPRQLSLSVGALDGQGGGLVFPGDISHPALTYQDVLAALPFQTDDRTFVLALYVMTRNLLEDIAPVEFQVKISNVDGVQAQVSYDDPLTGIGVPVEVISRENDSVTVTLPLTDYPRLLRVRE